MQSTDVPLTGRYVKHLDTREIIEWICYDPDTKLLLIRWPTGSYSLVHRRGISQITPHEEMRFLRLRVITAN
jgi:hypothetical protein